MELGIANKCYYCGNLTKDTDWVKDKQRPVCKSCKAKYNDKKWLEREKKEIRLRLKGIERVLKNNQKNK